MKILELLKSLLDKEAAFNVEGLSFVERSMTFVVWEWNTLALIERHEFSGMCPVEFSECVALINANFD